MSFLLVTGRETRVRVPHPLRPTPDRNGLQTCLWPQRVGAVSSTQISRKGRFLSFSAPKLCSALCERILYEKNQDPRTHLAGRRDPGARRAVFGEVGRA